MRSKFLFLSRIFAKIVCLWFTGYLSVAFFSGFGEESQNRYDNKDVPWKVGEKLIYEIRWGLVPAGTGSLEVKKQANFQEDSSVYRIEVRAVSNAFLDVFYKVRDYSFSLYDSKAGISHRFEQQIREGKYHMDQVVEFDWKSKRFKNSENVRGRQLKLEEGELNLPAVDILSSLYLARSRSLQVGEEYTFNVHSGKYWPLILKVLKREKVNVPAGSFECFMIEPFLRDRGLFVQKGKKLQVWMTADEKKVPVLIKAEIFIGQVTVELKEIVNSPE